MGRVAAMMTVTVCCYHSALAATTTTRVTSAELHARSQVFMVHYAGSELCSVGSPEIFLQSIVLVCLANTSCGLALIA